MSAPEGGLTLAVYHRSDNPESPFADLKQAAGVRLEFVRTGSLWTVPSNVSGVLWELSPEDGSQRLVTALISGLPAVSYSLSAQPGLLELSRALGFREHFVAPVQLADIERVLGVRDLLDLADRIDASGSRLIHLASQPDVVASVMRAVNLALDPAHVARALTSSVGEWLPIADWQVFAVEPDGVPRQVGAVAEAPETANVATQSLAEFIVKTGQSAVRVTNYLDERIDAAGQAKMVEASVVGWPLVVNGGVVGVLVGLDQGRARRLPSLSQAFTDAMVLLIEPAAYALSNALRVARAEALSVTDDLTQLYNSRYLNDALRKEAKRAMRSGWPLSLLFIDLDGFKRINDANGHVLGSRALLEAADLIRSSARETDVVARFGGDEFAMLLPETGVDGAQSVARRIRDRIQRFNFIADHSAGNRLTASIGIATLPDVADTAEGLLHAADAAMYRVKMAGKNGIHISGSETDAGRAVGERQELR